MQRRLKQKQIDFSNLLLSNLRDVNNPEEGRVREQKSNESMAPPPEDSTKSSSSSSENEKKTEQAQCLKQLVIELDGDEAEINLGIMQIVEDKQE
jgi:hypothetical protein